MVVYATFAGHCRSACIDMGDDCAGVSVTPLEEGFKCQFSSSGAMQMATDNSTTFVKRIVPQYR